MSTSRDNRQPVRNKGVGYFEAEACLMIWKLVKRVLNHLQMACQICAEGFVNREGFSVLLTKRLWHTNNKAQIKEKWRTMKLICSLDVFIISNKACSALNLFAFLFTLERFKIASGFIALLHFGVGCHLIMKAGSFFPTTKSKFLKRDKNEQIE